MSQKSPVDLEESFFETDSVRWRRLFPWLRLCDAIRLSLDPRKFLLATAGVVIYFALISAAERLPFFISGYRLVDKISYLTPQSVSEPPTVTNPARTLPLHESFSHWVAQPLGLQQYDTVVGQPLLSLLEPSGIAGVAEAVTRLLVGLIVWGIFGGAIARITALQFAGDHPASMWSSMRYAVSNLTSSVAAPILPLLGVLFFWGLTALGGLVGQIPTVGPPVVGVFWGLALFFGFLATLLSIGMALSWPMMISGTAVEGTDAFDALSRGFSYLFSRPVYLLLLVIAAGVIGTVLSGFVALITSLSVQVSERFLETSGFAFQDASSAGIGSAAHGIWIQAVWAGAASFGVGFFWTAATVVYFLLRLSVDAMPLDRIFVPDDPDADDLAPLVGIAASERREASMPTTGADPQDAGNSEGMAPKDSAESDQSSENATGDDAS